MKLVEENRIQVVSGGTKPMSVIKALAESPSQKEAFYVVDVGDIVNKYDNWVKKLPKIKPFYAVKCNNSPVIIKILAGLGAGFDCASRGEIMEVMNLGVPADRIIFANPAKQSTHIKYAAKVGVNLMTFDNLMELQKVKAHHPNAELVLRVRADSVDVQCKLGIKFGAEFEEAGPLLEAAANLKLNVVGVSFHVGSGCREAGAHARAIEISRRVFDMAEALGFSMRLLDIGGGFPGDKGSNIDEMSVKLKKSIECHFSDNRYEVIAEPGRYFVSSAFTLATMVHSIRAPPGARTMYYINDGVYGSFNCILYEGAVKTPRPLKEGSAGEWVPSSVWGPTCDAVDLVCDNVPLPPLDEEDWLVFEDMGAYTIACACTFNGMPLPKINYIVSHKHWERLSKLVDDGELFLASGEWEKGELCGEEEDLETIVNKCHGVTVSA